MKLYVVWRKFRRWIRKARKKLAVFIAGEDFPFLVVPAELPERCIRSIVVSETLSMKMYNALDKNAIKKRLIKASYDLISEQAEYTERRVEHGVACEIEFYLLRRED